MRSTECRRGGNCGAGDLEAHGSERHLGGEEDRLVNVTRNRYTVDDDREGARIGGLCHATGTMGPHGHNRW